MLNHSCEEVLKRIFEHEGPLYLVEEGEKKKLLRLRRKWLNL